MSYDGVSRFSPAHVIGERIHGWMAPLVDSATLAAIERAEQAAQIKGTDANLHDRILELLTTRSMTASQIATELNVSEKTSKNAISRLRKIKAIDGEYGPMLRKRCCKVYGVAGT